MKLPDRITAVWMDSLSDDSLSKAERQLHRTFASIEKDERAKLGLRYDLMRGPAELMLAWDRWSRVSTGMRHRGLNPRRA